MDLTPRLGNLCVIQGQSTDVFSLVINVEICDEFISCDYNNAKKFLILHSTEIAVFIYSLSKCLHFHRKCAINVVMI